MRSVRELTTFGFLLLVYLYIIYNPNHKYYNPNYKLKIAILKTLYDLEDQWMVGLKL
jgi:hypothetical protein